MKKIIMLLCAISMVICANANDNKKAPSFARKARLENTHRLVKRTDAVKGNENILSLDALKNHADKSIRNSDGSLKTKGRRPVDARPSATPTPSAYSSTYNYKCGPTKIEVEDLSTSYYSQFKLKITQDAKNVTEYNKTTLYASTVEIILDPDEHSIVGTFSYDDYSIGYGTFVKYGNNTRYVSATQNSTITIESRGGNKYALTSGKLAVENASGTYLYNYNYCYANEDLNDQNAPVTPFEFEFGEDVPSEGPELVTPPAGLQTEEWMGSASGMYSSFGGKMIVGWDNNDVYIQGLCPDFPTSWVKGTLEDGVVTFAKDQYLGEYYGFDIWMEGSDVDGNLCDFTMSYNAGTSKLSATNYLVENTSVEELSFLDFFYPVYVWDPNVEVKRDTVDLVSSTLRVDRQYDYGEYEFWDENEDFYLDLWVFTDTPDGTFSIANGKLDSWSAIMIGSEIITLVDGEVTVIVDGKTATMTGGFVGNDEKYYRINITGKFGGLPHDEPYIPFNAEFAFDDVFNSFEEGDVVISAVNENSQCVSIQLFLPVGAITVPAGTYPISDSKEIGTAMIGSIDADEVVDGSYAGILSSSSISDVWYMASGTVTVAEDGSITVSAKNSYDVDVNITILAPERPELGEVFTDEESGLVFKVTSVEEDHETVEVLPCAPGAEYAGEIVIPAVVVKGIVGLDVTSIADQAFSQCTGITKITIGENVANIGKAAFSFCTGLTEKIICDGKPATVGKSAFYKVNPAFVPDLAK